MVHNLDLRISVNSYSVRPSENLSLSIAKSAEMKKVRLFGRFILGLNRGAQVYYAKNCVMTCFDGAITYEPNPHTPFPPLTPEDRRVMDRIRNINKTKTVLRSDRQVTADIDGITFHCGTAAYIFLERNRIIREINLQLLHNLYLAGDEYSRFIDVCSHQFGAPIFWDINGPVQRRGAGITAGWLDDKSCVYANLSTNEKHFLIIWLKR